MQRLRLGHDQVPWRYWFPVEISVEEAGWRVEGIGQGRGLAKEIGRLPQLGKWDKVFPDVTLTLPRERLPTENDV